MERVNPAPRFLVRTLLNSDFYLSREIRQLLAYPLGQILRIGIGIALDCRKWEMNKMRNTKPDNGREWHTIFYRQHRSAKQDVKTLLVSTVDPIVFANGRDVDPGFVVVTVKRGFRERLGFTLQRDIISQVILALEQAKAYLDTEADKLQEKLNKTK